MLLKALLNRLSGGTDSSQNKSIESRKRLARATYNKYPRLAELVDDLLRRSFSWRSDETLEDQTSRQVHNAFPAMEIIDRIGVADHRRDIVQSLLRQQLASPIWTLRDKAARTLGYLTNEAELILQIKEGIETHQMSQNQLHGILLCLKFRLEDLPRINSGELGPILMWKTVSNPCTDLILSHFSDLSDLFASLVLENSCLYTACAYLESMTLLLQAMLRNEIDSGCSIEERSIENRKRMAIHIEQLSVSLQACNRIFDQDSQMHMQMKIRDNMGHGNVKQALARFKASSELLRSTIALRSTPAASDSNFSISPENETGGAYLEALQVQKVPADVRYILLAMKVYLHSARAGSGEEQALGCLANLLNMTRTTIPGDLKHDGNLKQETLVAGTDVLANPEFISPESPTAAQSALVARGGILSLLYFCDERRPSTDIGQRIRRWSRSLRLWLVETSASHSCLALALGLMSDYRTFLPDLLLLCPLNLSRRLLLDLGKDLKIRRHNYRFAVPFMTLLSMTTARSGRRPLELRLACSMTPQHPLQQPVYPLYQQRL